VKKLSPSKGKISHVLYTVLLSIAAALFVVLVTGTVVGLVRSRNAPPLLGPGNPIQTQQPMLQADDIRVYPGLGRLRIPLSNSSTMILSIAFPYSAGDIAFTEELNSKINDLRKLTEDYFISLPERNLMHIDEDLAKQEILRSFNNHLRLGRIEALYFTDMIIFSPDGF